MNLDEIERLIDRAIEDEDFEKLVRLLDERERIFKANVPSPEKAREILKRDRERLERIEGMRKNLLEYAFKSREYLRHLESQRRSQRGRSWGKG